jgi:hypothetical protein
MRSTLRAIALALSLLTLFTPRSSATVEAGPSAVGTGTVSLGDDLKRRFEFKAVMNEDEGATGYMALSDPAEIPARDVDGSDGPDAEGSPSGLELMVELDSMKVKNNRAVLSGVVTSTNLARYAGVRLILTVEDNGEDGKGAGPDLLTWGVYRALPERPVADAENSDAGSYMVSGAKFDIDRFPLSSYSLTEIDEGDIQVRP